MGLGLGSCWICDLERIWETCLLIDCWVVVTLTDIYAYSDVFEPDLDCDVASVCVWVVGADGPAALVAVVEGRLVSVVTVSLN